MQSCILLAMAIAFQPGAKPISSLMDDVSKRAVKFFWEQSNPQTGLTKDRASNFKPDTEHTVASVAATGYALAAYAVGAHRGWLPRKESLLRARHTLDWLNKHGLKQNGWFYHFVDWSDGHRMWGSEVSSIDTGLLVEGALMAQSEFKDAQFDAEVKQLLGAIDWKWMLTDGGRKPDEKTLSMGWHPEDGFINARWDRQYEETFLFVQSLGAYHGMPEGAWEAIDRPVTTYQGIPLMIGGCIFMHEMSQGFLDFKGKRDKLGFDYWVEGRNACLANRQYCIDNPKHFQGYGPNFWGLNAGDAPTGYVGNGAPNGSDDGTISPTGAIASIMYIPEIAESTANNIKALYPQSYGRYGFSNGICPEKNWVGPDVIGIDLGMAMLAIENVRDGLPHRLSMENPVNQRGMSIAGFHKTEEGPLDKRPLQLKG